MRDTYDGEERKSLFNLAEPYIDRSFIIDENKLANLGYSNERVVLIRLYDLYKMHKKTLNPQFFPRRDMTSEKKLSSDPYLPSFAV